MFPFVFGSIENGKKIADQFLLSFSWIVRGALTAVLGAAQIVCWPLAFSIKPLVRLVINEAAAKPKIEHNPGMQARLQVAKMLQNNSNDLFDTCHDVHRKFKKCSNKGQATDVPSPNETTAYNQVVTDRGNAQQIQVSALAYLKLFDRNFSFPNNVQVPQPPAYAGQAQRME